MTFRFKIRKDRESLILRSHPEMGGFLLDLTRPDAFPRFGNLLSGNLFRLLPGDRSSSLDVAAHGRG